MKIVVCASVCQVWARLLQRASSLAGGGRGRAKIILPGSVCACAIPNWSARKWQGLHVVRGAAKEDCPGEGSQSSA